MRTVLFALLLTLSSAAQALEEADRGPIRAVIERQIEAFRRDDAAAAYAQAAPSIQGLFPSQEGFMRMVGEGYAPVYRPRTFSFAEERDGAAGPIQTVRIQDEEGRDWIALYSLERQPDGTWRISGCSLTREPGETV